MSPNSGRRERRAFEYYFQHVAKYLSGGMAINFWTDVVPQLCRTEPAVWDAMIAISGLFEHPDQCTDFTLLRTNDKNSYRLDQSQQEALAWYSRSISSIQSQIERGRADPYIALISCVLFVCIETIQGRMEEALKIYEQGVKLIFDLRAQVALGGVSTTKAALLEHTLIPLFLRLGTVSLTVSGFQPSKIFALAEHNTSTSMFTSIDSARSAITVLATEVMLFEREARTQLETVGSEAFVSLDMLARKEGLQDRLADWKCAYDSYCHNVTAISSSPLAAEPVLLTYHAAASISLSGCLTLSEAVYDTHIAEFATIVEQAGLMLSASAGPDGSQPPFTFEMGVGIPLFLTSMKCRDRNLRHQALQLLRQAPPMQAFFKCTPVALLAKNLAKIEEDYAQMMRKVESYRGLPDIRLSATGAALMRTMPELLPMEARVSFRGVFRPTNGFPPGITDSDVKRWARAPDQLYLNYSRHTFDPLHNTRQQVSEIVPLEA